MYDTSPDRSDVTTAAMASPEGRAGASSASTVEYRFQLLIADHIRETAMDKLSISPKTTALLLMDFQRMVVDRYAVDKEQLLGRVKRLAVAARNSGAMVIHVVVSFRLGFPEVSVRNATFRTIKGAGLFVKGDLPPRLTPSSLLATHGVVLSTLRNAADMDYRSVVVADGCSDKDPEVQRVLMEKIFPGQAGVATVEECIGAIL
jgi:nicotinamidase-related amidase